MSDSEPTPPAPGAGDPAVPAALSAGIPGGLEALEHRLQQFGSDPSRAFAGAPEGAPPPGESPAASRTDEHLDELVDDMVHVLQRLQALEAGQAAIQARLDRLEATLRDDLKQQTREVDAIRRDLLGQQRVFAAKSAFEALVPALDRLRPMRAALSPKKHETVVAQLDAITSTLSSTLRALGYEPFEPRVGDPFDPERMRGVGTAKGAPGVVLGVDQPGYVAGGVVMRPAGVLLAPVPTTRP